jgi:hypothetical protein|tara:strand:- start:132 stop:299 length:168 start_codon:yes stop_codon:yes gene_type:complete
MENKKEEEEIKFKTENILDISFLPLRSASIFSIIIKIIIKVFRKKILNHNLKIQK